MNLRSLICILCTLIMLSSTDVVYSDPEIQKANQVELDALQQTTAEWIRVERSIKEESDRGKLQQAQLKQLKEVVQSQRDRWKKEVLALEASASKADEERKAILGEKKILEESKEKAISQLKALESKLRGLRAMAPEPLLKELALPLLKLDRPFREEEWLDRYQAALTILQTTHGFHRRYSLSQHDVRIGSDQPKAGTILYMGLSNAYFLSIDGEKAGWGKPSPRGWVWKSADEHKENIRSAISMAEGKSLDFELANLPVEVQP